MLEDLAILKYLLTMGTVKFSIASRFKIPCLWFSRYHCSFSYFSHYLKQLMGDDIEFGFNLLFVFLTCKLRSCFLIFPSLGTQSFLTVYSLLSFKESFLAPLLFPLVESPWPSYKQKTKFCSR